MEEVWKPVLGYEGLYEVSNLGMVRSIFYKRLKNNAILSPRKVGDGYLAVNLSKNKKKNSLRIHRLVWEAFNGPIPKGMQVNHINEDKTDNRLENLNLMTPKENINWGTRNERSRETKTNGELSKTVLQYSLSGEFIRDYPSASEAGRQLEKPNSSICRCCNGKLKTAYGFIWRYAV